MSHIRKYHLIRAHLVRSKGVVEDGAALVRCGRCGIPCVGRVEIRVQVELLRDVVVAGPRGGGGDAGQICAVRAVQIPLHENQWPREARSERLIKVQSVQFITIL